MILFNGLSSIIRITTAEEWIDVTGEPDLDAAGWRFFKAAAEMR